MYGSQKEAGLAIDGFGNEVVLLAFQLDRPRDDRHRNLQQRRRRIDQLVLMDGTVTILGKLLQDVTDASLRADDRVTRDPQPLRQSIRRLKADTVDVERQAIRILLDPDNGVVPIGLA